MSASQEPDISDIHPTTVAETLSVSTSEPVPPSIVQHAVGVGGVSLPNVAPVSPVALPQAPQLTVNVTDGAHSIPPAVGASISVQDSGTAASITDRASSALLNIASNSLNLTEILNAQQQALEQFQCQLQLAQQTEAINQRLDAIERTLNSLIQQKAQEDAVKSQQQQQQSQQPQQQPQLSPGLGTPIRPSQQLQVSALEMSGDGSDSKKRKLPRELCSKVRSTYHTLNLDFKIDERFLSPTNQRVTDSLIDSVYKDTSAVYSVKQIKRAVHRYYESRRRVGIDELPERQEKAAEQRKKRKYRARQQRAYDRRSKFVRESETRYWDQVTTNLMTEESDSESGQKIVTHQLLWRSEFLNQFIQKLDSRYEKSKKLGSSSSVKRERVAGLPSTSQPPPSLPSWMIDPSYKMPASTTVCISNPSSVGVDDPDHTSLTIDGQDPTAEDLTTYTTLIADVQEVQDDSSDFELPETVVA